VSDDARTTLNAIRLTQLQEKATELCLPKGNISDFFSGRSGFKFLPAPS